MVSRPARALTAALALLLITAVLPAGAAAAKPKPADPDKPAEGAATTIQSDYRRDPYLSDEKKKLLDRLAGRSETTLAAESWARAGTVGRLELSVSSGLEKGASLAEHALAFVTANGALWNLPDGAPLTVSTTTPDGDCTSVTITLQAQQAPVFNASLTIVLTPDGTIRGAAGQFDGAAIREVAPLRVSAQDAATAVRKYLAERVDGAAGDVELPKPTTVVVAPQFIADGSGDAGTGWLFTTEAGGTGSAPVAVVNGQTGAVVVVGTGVTVPNRTIIDCPDSNPVKVFLPFILDPMTRTPAIVQFGSGGTPTEGATATERAYHLLEQGFMLDMYGDRNPRKHLQDPQEIPGVAGRTTVRFQEYYGGIPVEGARLSVSLLPNGNAELVTARFVYFPHARTEPTVSESGAVAAATARYADLECAGDPYCETLLAAELQAHPAETSLVILSAEIFAGTDIPALPPGQERLVYKIEFPRRVLYWDATDNQQRWEHPVQLSATPHTIRNAEQGNRIEVVNGVPAAGVTPHLDATRVSAWLNTVDSFYQNLGRNGFDDASGSIDVIVRDERENASWCFTKFLDRCGTRMRIGVTHTADDIVAHEFTHGVVEATTGYKPGGEPGALNEHYADVLASVVFPDSNPNDWLIGEDSIRGAFRDMAHPEDFGDPAHYANLGAVCSEAAWCAHSWAGVPNRAAVLISDGGAAGSNHPGVGRQTLATLYLATLESGLGGDSDLFLDERLNTLATCAALADAGTVVAGRPLTDADCDHVGRAFDTVGVSAPYDIGWTRFSSGLFGSHTEVEVRQGLELYRGCTIANHILRGEDDSGEVKESDVADGMVINFAGEWGANVTWRAAATDPIQRGVGYRMWTEWFNTGVVDVVEVYAKPAGVTDEECRTLPGTHRRAMYSTARVSHWATFFNGGKGDDVINAGVRLPAGCAVAAVLGQHYHDWGIPEGAPGASLNHEGEHGFRINRSVADPERDLDVSVHWWHEGFTSIKVRVLYLLHEPDGWDCAVSGLQDNP